MVFPAAVEGEVEVEEAEPADTLFATFDFPDILHLQ